MNKNPTPKSDNLTGLLRAFMTKHLSNQQTTTETARSEYEKTWSAHLKRLANPAFVAQQRTATEKAWSRIGLDTWSQMVWFVKLANTTGFETMTDGEQLLWKEEFVAMFLIGNALLIGVPPDTKRYPRSPESPPPTPAQMDDFGILPPTPAQMQEVRDVIAPHIDELADDKGTLMGGFDITYTVSFHKNAAFDQNKELPRYLIYRGETGRAVYNIYQHSLLLGVSKLLEAYADKVRRCEHCMKVFLQLKRSAKYCGPKCYTVGCMQEFRAAQMTRKEKGKKQARRVSAKGGRRHGAKKR